MGKLISRIGNKSFVDEQFAVYEIEYFKES